MADQAPPEDVQNSNTGSSAGDTDASADSVASAAVTPTFPDRLRVHALAKIIGVTSKQVLAKLGELGIEARSVQSSLGRDVAQTVHASFAEPAQEASPAPKAADVAAEPVVSETPVVEPVVPEPAVPEPAVSEPEAPSEPADGLFAAPAAPDTTSVARPAFATPLFLQPEAAAEAPPKRRRSRKAAGPAAEPETSDKVVEAPADQARIDKDSTEQVSEDQVAVTGSEVASTAEDTKSDTADTAAADSDSSSDDNDDDQSQPRRRRRGRRGRGRGRGDQTGDGSSDDDSDDGADTGASRSGDSTSGASSSEDESQRGDSDRADSDRADSDRADSDRGDSDTDASGTDDNDTEDNDSDGDKPAGERRSRRRSRSRSGARSGEGTEGEESKPAPDSESDAEQADDSATDSSSEDSDDEDQDGSDGSSRRRRRRRRRRNTGDASSDGASSEDDPPNTVVHEREPRNKSRNKDEVQGITGSTRLEAKRQRRRDGRDAGRRRPPILTESEFLARRESVDRVMVVREKSFPDHGDTTQVAVLEDGVLVEHFVTSSASASMVGNVYLGRVQNVLPSMEAAFIDIGRGRNGVLYAGEVNWDAAGLGGNSRKIEQALKPGDQVLVQVSKDPVGHKGARLTTQLSLAGRYLVYVPGGSSTGISRKLPDTERKRLKEILREIVPSEAGVIIRTAAEGVSEEELARDVERLQAQWATIEEASAKAETGKGSQPQTLYEEPDLLVKVIRDLFNEDFVKLVIEGEKAWKTTSNYIETVAADMLPKLERHNVQQGKPDVFEAHRIDEQLAKALDRKVWLPSGGTLVIDRTEAMTVVDVNTGKFTGAGGNLEETVTRNNLEAAEEVVRQMRLRDIGGMIVVDFIDMVLEQNRDLVLRRLTEALGRDRTRHQVSEVTSLGLVQMTRKKLGTGLVEAFSTTCEHCQGRGIVVHPFPVEAKQDDGSRSSSRGDSGSQRKRRGRDKADNSGSGSNGAPNEQHDHAVDPSVKRAHPVALAMAAHHDEVVADVTPAEVEDKNEDASTVDTTVIGESEVAAAQGKSDQLGQGSATDSTASAQQFTPDVESNTDTDVTAAAGDESNVTPRRRSGRRKASRPTAAPPAEPTDQVETGVTEVVESRDDAPVAEVSADEAPAVDSNDAASEAVSDDSVALSVEPAAVTETAVTETVEPVVKARRGRRVARQAAAPTSEAPDAGAVFVIPVSQEDKPGDGSTGTEEPAAAPVTTPAFVHTDGADTGADDVQEVPESKPRRRRAAARPAGPPVDA